MVKIGNSWDDKLKPMLENNDFHNFLKLVDHEYLMNTVYPPRNYIFNALKLTPFENVKVVIMGQDPYHGEGEAHGLSFSVQKGIKVPPSLQNIYKELYDDLGVPIRHDGDLTGWALEGVLLLNAVLTVLKDQPASHRNLGWEKLTDYIIQLINEKEEPVVFILWGNFAKEKRKYITNPKHYIITSPHPSPFSARNGFFGSRPFSKCNDYLISQGISPVHWERMQ